MDRSDILNSFVKGASIVAVGMVASKILTYLFRVVIARPEFIGPAGYGQFSQGLVALNIIGVFSLLGVNQAINKYVAEYRAADDKAGIKGVLVSSLQLVMPLSILASILIYLSSGLIANHVFHSPEMVPILQRFAIIPPFANLSSIMIATITAYKRMEYRVLTNQIFQNVVQLAVAVALIMAGLGVTGAVWGWIAGVVLSSLLALYFVEAKLGPILTSSVVPDLQRRKLVKFSAPLMLSAAIATLLGWTDTLFLGYFLTDFKVGLYNAAFPTALLILIPFQAIGSIALPSFSELRESDEKSIPDVLHTITRWTISLSFPAFALMALFSDQVLHLLFGQPYKEASLALTVLAFGNLVNASTGRLRDLLKSFSETNLILKITTANLAVNVLLNIYLIPRMGLLGAAFATSLSIIFVNSVLVIETYRREKMLPFNRYALIPVAAAAVSIPVVQYGLNSAFNYVPLWALVPGLAAFGILYSLLFVLLGGFRPEDEDIIRAAGRKFGLEQEAEKIISVIAR